MMVGSGSPVGPKGPKKSAQAMTAKKDGGGEDGVFPCGVGNEGDAGLSK